MAAMPAAVLISPLASRAGNQGPALEHDQLQSTKSELLATISKLRREAPGEALGLILRDLGEVERKLGNHEAACGHYGESVALLRIHGGPLRYAHTVRHLGDVYRKLGHLDRARPCYEEALTTYRSHPEAAELDMANAKRSMAILEQECGNRAASRQLWGEARQSYATLGIDAGVAECERCLHKLADS